jgi:uncharacterized protein YkwD
MGILTVNRFRWWLIPSLAGLVLLPLVVSGAGRGSRGPLSDFERRVFELTNEERVKRDIPPLNLNYSLVFSARDHTVLMTERDTLSHRLSGEPDVCDRMRQTDYEPLFCGENIATGYSTPEEVVAAWMRSTGHRRNILNPNYRDLGVAYVYEGATRTKHWWTQNFASPATDVPTVTPPYAEPTVARPPCLLREDVNDDRTVDYLDLELISAVWGVREGDPEWNARFDILPDGIIDIIDVISVIYKIGESCPD